MMIEVRQEWKQKSITSPGHVTSVARAILAMEDEHDHDKEHAWVFGLDTEGQIKYVDLVHVGSLNQCPMHPREIFRLAVIKAANAVVIAHNHPSSGAPKPSDYDKDVTRRMVLASKVLGIKVLDHVIVGDAGHFSFADGGMI